MSLMKRIIPNVIDQLLILITFSCMSLLIFRKCNAPANLGVYITLLEASPDVYAYPTINGIFFLMMLILIA